MAKRFDTVSTPSGNRGGSCRLGGEIGEDHVILNVRIDSAELAQNTLRHSVKAAVIADVKEISAACLDKGYQCVL